MRANYKNDMQGMEKQIKQSVGNEITYRVASSKLKRFLEVEKYLSTTEWKMEDAHNPSWKKMIMDCQGQQSRQKSSQTETTVLLN